MPLQIDPTTRIMTITGYGGEVIEISPRNVFEEVRGHRAFYSVREETLRALIAEVARTIAQSPQDRMLLDTRRALDEILQTRRQMVEPDETTTDKNE